jgi:NADH-quinone oxidoreductase subunit C
VSAAETPSSGEVMHPGHALPAGTPAPVTLRNVPHRGGNESPSVASLRARFGAAILRSEVIWGDTTVYVAAAPLLEIMQWLRDDPSQRYDYLVDITAVEYREASQPLQVVWHLRSLPFRRFLRVKVELEKGKPFAVDSVWPIWKSANWLEREVLDMFGVEFHGHPDPRRMLMWEQYREGHPLRKDFPLRGRFSRSEQLRQALAANPEAHYSMNELSVAEAFGDLPTDMKQRLAAGEVTGE